MNSTLTRYGARGRTIGRPPRDDRRGYYARRFGLQGEKARLRHWDWKLLNQLDACKCDCARRLILGCSEKWGEDEESYLDSQIAISPETTGAFLGP